MILHCGSSRDNSKAFVLRQRQPAREIGPARCGRRRSDRRARGLAPDRGGHLLWGRRLLPPAYARRNSIASPSPPSPTTVVAAPPQTFL